MPVVVELSERDVHILRKQAKKRNRTFEESNNWDNDAKTYGVDAEERNFRGVLGELAFAKYAGLTIDPNEYEKTDQGEDFYVWYQGERCTLDIKVANKEPYALMVKEGTVRADYYIPGYLDDRTVTFYGIASGKEVQSGELVDTPYEHRNHEIPVEELDPVPEPETLRPIG